MPVLCHLVLLVVFQHCYSRFSHDVTAAMLLYRTIAETYFENLILLVCKTWVTFLHQHGCLITWVKTKNTAKKCANPTKSPISFLNKKFSGFSLFSQVQHFKRTPGNRPCCTQKGVGLSGLVIVNFLSHPFSCTWSEFYRSQTDLVV